MSILDALAVRYGPALARAMGRVPRDYGGRFSEYLRAVGNRATFDRIASEPLAQKYEFAAWNRGPGGSLGPYGLRTDAKRHTVSVTPEPDSGGGDLFLIHNHPRRRSLPGIDAEEPNALSAGDLAILDGDKGARTRGVIAALIDPGYGGRGRYGHVATRGKRWSRAAQGEHGNIQYRAARAMRPPLADDPPPTHFFWEGDKEPSQTLNSSVANVAALRAMDRLGVLDYGYKLPPRAASTMARHKRDLEVGEAEAVSRLHEAIYGRPYPINPDFIRRLKAAGWIAGGAATGLSLAGLDDR